MDTLDQLEQALAAGADIILLDNFAAADVARAVERAHEQQPRPLLEVSGGVTLATRPCPGRHRGRHPVRGRPHPFGPRGGSVAGAAAGRPAMADAPADLQPAALHAHLHTERAGPDLRGAGRSAIPPTTAAPGCAREGAPEGQLVVADTQTGGRGRLGRSWFSPAGQNLYLSLLLRPDGAGAPPAPADPGCRGGHRRGAVDRPWPAAASGRG